MDYNPSLLSKAVNDFRGARRKAALQFILWALHLTRRPAELLSYDEVRQKLRAFESSSRKLEDIPLDAIVGSVNRYSDFTRSFLPLQDSDKDRWARVKVGVDRMIGLPPIEAYKVGDAYFVLDGHHRVSVAREMGAQFIEGYVIPVRTRVPLSPEDGPDDIIIKSEYTDFLASTHIDDLRPDANLLFTAPGQYPKLLEHIEVHRYFLGQQRKKDVSFKEAVTDWYDTVYLPVTTLIRDRNLLRDFPGRTETDLYLWILEYRSALGGDKIGWEVSTERAAADFTAHYSPQRRITRIKERLSHLIIPKPLTSGPPPGQWREEHQSPHRGDRLFDDILVTVPVKGDRRPEAGWQTVNAAIEVAKREEARLTGFHVAGEEEQKDNGVLKQVQDEFMRRCNDAGIFGRFVVETGDAVAPLVCQRSPWVDLVVYRMNFPPPTQPIRRLRSGARLMIRQCSSPLLAVADSNFQLDSALLAYGPGHKADEALFVATYLAGRWNLPLTVLVVNDARPSEGKPSSLERARAYLEDHNIQARYIEESGEPAQCILLSAESQNTSLLVMGGYESSPFREALFGSTVDRVLRSTRRPVLICR
jgi:nucleotide-binding universal stress UspA family protein